VTSPRFLEPPDVLGAARLAGSAVLGIVAQAAIDMPDGYFGARDHVTAAGAAYAVCLVLATGLVLLGRSRRWPVAGWLPPVVLASNVGVFATAVATDPMVAGGMVGWNLTLLALHFFPVSSDRGPAVSGAAETEPEDRRIASQAPAVRHLAAVSLVLTTAIVGYQLSEGLFARLVCMAFGVGTVLLAWPVLKWLRQGGSRLALLVPVPAAAALIATGRPTIMLALLAVAEALLVAALVVRQRSTVEILRAFYEHPSRLIVASFAGAVAAGTVLLTFPAASAGSAPVDPIDAFFTATSATCVTGLIVLDTPHDFSTFGQVVILLLIQVGGLGTMVVSTFATLLLGGRLGLRGEQALFEVLDLEAGAAAYRLTRFIVLSTLAIEAVGAAGLAWCFGAAGHEAGAAAWHGLFHAVSAFCNAGFALHGDSAVLFRESPPALVLLIGLITAGGLGFVVLAGIAGRLAGGRRRDRLPVQTRVVLAASALLVTAGTALFALGEWRRSLAGLGPVDKLLNALFQSVTLRTAGFNTVDLAAIAPATVFFMILFMFVGASPGSTGGGIKTTTAAVLVAAIRSASRGGSPVLLYGREVPRDVVLRSLAITAVSAAVVALGLFLLLLFETLPFEQLFFEAVSAFATVGLSLGATAHLGPAGKLVIVAMMFVGRIGPLTLALLLGARHHGEPACRHPETRLMVG
jgi:trk system potassium uptake protein TrkH